MIIPLEFLLFLLLVGERLHHFLPKQTVLNTSIQLANLHTLFPKCLPHPQIDCRTGHCHNWHHHKDNQRQPHADLRQNDKGNHCLDSRDKKLLRAVVRKFRHVKKVVGDAPHNLPDLGIIIVGVR